MKRFRRILFSTLTTISLILALATAGLWVRSLFKIDMFFFPPRLAVIARGAVEINPTGSNKFPGVVINSEERWRHHELEFLPEEGMLDRILGGARLPGVEMSRVLRGNSYVCPLWFVLAVAAILPASRLVLSLRRLRRRHSGHCPACGHDIRANPAKCSECGHEPDHVPRD